MLLLDRQSGATAQPRGEPNRSGATAGRIQLRLRADGQVLELLPGKTTIGSSPRCNVRIEQPGVQPLHCLIVDGPEGLRVRSWVANTTLNGVPFEESALAVGDCLSLGSVEFEVVDPRAEMSQPKAVEAPAAESKDAEQIRAGRDQARLAVVSCWTLCDTSGRLTKSCASKLQNCRNRIWMRLPSRTRLAASWRDASPNWRLLGSNWMSTESVETARQQLAEQNEQLGFEIGELSAQINELTHGQDETANGSADSLPMIMRRSKNSIDN